MPDTEALLKRIMPHSVDGEKSVIGSMLTSKDAIVEAAGILGPEDFYATQYGVLFRAITELDAQGKDVDLVTLKSYVSTMKDVPESITGLEFVKEILESSYTASYVKQYCEIVKEKSLLRRLIKINDEITNDCFEGKEPADTVLEETEKKIFELVQNKNTSQYTPIDQIVMTALRQIRIASETKGSVTGVASGFTDLDKKTAGFQPSDLILIAARPSMGKTAFVLNVADYVCFHLKKTTVLFSLEMSKEQLVNRLFALEAKIDAQHLRTGSLSDKEWISLMDSADTIAKSNLIIDDTPNITVSELRSKCRRYMRDRKIDLIIIDYLQLMNGSGRTDSRQQEISDISRALKALARELNVPVIALSQLSRAVEKREDRRPILSDLRESGAIEQDADVVMFLYREEYYFKNTENKDIAELIIAKQRNGPTGTVKLAWLSEFTKFGNLLQQT